MKTVVLLEELSEYELNTLNRDRPLDVSIEQLIYAYEGGAWDGIGAAVYLDNKGQWHFDELGHCSCYGAFDGGFNNIGYTKEQLVELLKKRTEDSWLQVHCKLVLAEVEKEGSDD